ncbi:hypothetical protein [Paraburkholderia oxyphila]|uniref:hypothetical protein n=1 Tax=Paraburkholderia oxyphila TaxID=614212 RepID=UPI000481B388
MCTAFDVSKTPLREALKVLVSEGRERGAANAGWLRWSESMDEHEAILAALEDPAHADLPQIPRMHSEQV